MTLPFTTSGLTLETGLIADSATTAESSAGPCAICDRAILRGQRIARLIATGQRVHTSCTPHVSSGPAT